VRACVLSPGRGDTHSPSGELLLTDRRTVESPGTPGAGVGVALAETPLSGLSLFGGQSQVETTTMTAGTAIGVSAVFAFLVLWVASHWITFSKANEPGWASLIPIYNIYVMLKIGDNEWWWLLVLLFVPIANFYALYKVGAGVARAFGKGGLYGFGLGYLPFIFFPLLAFGDAQYQGRSRSDAASGGI